MSFLLPAFLLALPLALLPVIIHLLNRLRFKTVKWAAMMFLLSANRASTRRARIRHWLILASRCLMLALLLLAVARPVLGGVLGASIAGAPDTVLLLLDRSASMETVDPRQQMSRRAHALRLFASAAASTAKGSRFVLLDSATQTPSEIADVAALADTVAAQRSGTAADIPALLRAAVDYIAQHPVGRSEIWLASDLQASNWQVRSRNWADLQSRIAALPGDVRLRILALNEPVPGDVAIQLRGTRSYTRQNTSTLLLDYTLRLASGGKEGSLPLDITQNGIRHRVEIPITGQEMLLTRRIDLPPESAHGWLKLELPADANRQNNAIHVVYGPQPLLQAFVAVKDIPAARLARLAVAEREGMRSAIEGTVADLAKTDLSKTSLVILQTSRTSPELNSTLESFVRSGGRVLLLPPSDEAATGPFDLGWHAIEKNAENKSWAVSVWDSATGPLADTSTGRNLPVADLAMAQRRIPFSATSDEGSLSPWENAASFRDGSAFLLRRTFGRGSIYALATLPLPTWSNLSDGVVWVPMIQRLLQEGGAVLSTYRTDTCGLWKPVAEPQEFWTSLSGSPTDSPQTQPGVYQYADRQIALNLPDSEFEPDTLAVEEVPALLPGVSVQMLSDLHSRDASGATSEAWRAAIVLSLLFMVIELILLLGERLPVAQADSTRRAEVA